VIVSATSLYDLAHLGTLGAVPGRPGPDRCPAQPMIAQTRAVLDAYAARGGSYREPEERGERVDRQRQREGDVRDDQGEPGVSNRLSEVSILNRG